MIASNGELATYARECAYWRLPHEATPHEITNKEEREAWRMYFSGFNDNFHWPTTPNATQPSMAYPKRPAYVAGFKEAAEASNNGYIRQSFDEWWKDRKST